MSIAIIVIVKLIQQANTYFPIIAQAMIWSAFPSANIRANQSSLSNFLPIFQLLGADEHVYDRLVNILFGLICAQSGHPKLFLISEKRIHRKFYWKMLNFSMIRIFFCKLLGNSCDIRIFKLGYRANYRFIPNAIFCNWSSHACFRVSIKQNRYFYK